MKSETQRRNKYKKSLDAYQEMKVMFEKFAVDTFGLILDNADLIEDKALALLFKLGERWDHAYTIEQLHDYRNIAISLAFIIDSYYSREHEILYGDLYCRMFDEKVHDRRPILTLKSLEKVVDLPEHEADAKWEELCREGEE